MSAPEPGNPASFDHSITKHTSLDDRRMQPTNNNQASMNTLPSKPQISAAICSNSDNFQAPTPNTNPPPVNFLHLELIFHFQVKDVIPEGACLVAFHLDILSKYAMSATNLMRVILSVSALHLSVLKPDQQEFYRRESRGLLDHDQPPSSAGEDTTRETRVPDFLYSALLSFHQLCRTMIFCSDDFDTLVKGIVRYLEMYRNHSTTARESWNRAYEAELRCSVLTPEPSEHVKKGKQCDDIKKHIKRSVSDTSAQNTFLEASEGLQRRFAVVSARQKSRLRIHAAMTWPVTVSANYCSLVRERNSMALMILAHYGALLQCLCDELWFLGEGGGAHLVRAIKNYLGQDWIDVTVLSQYG